MKKGFVLIVAMLAGAAFAAFGDVVASFPAPGSNPGGLAWDGTYLWYADYGSGTNQPSTIYKMTTTGSFLGQWVVNWPYAMGLAWDGTYLWCDSLTVRYVYRLNPANCSVISSFYGPSAHMMGMCCDGTYLYINDWQDRRVAKVTFTGQLQQLIPLTFPNNQGPSAVALEGEYLWSNSRDFWNPANAYAYKCLKSTGSVVASFWCPDSQATDFAYSDVGGYYLWISGYTTKMIYKVDVYSDVGVMPASLGKVKALYR